MVQKSAIAAAIMELSHSTITMDAAICVVAVSLTIAKSAAANVAIAAVGQLALITTRIVTRFVAVEPG